MMQSEKKRFLFLQGVASPFFNTLGRALVTKGHDVYKINFCGGDKVYWNSLPSWDFQGTQGEWPAYVEEKILSNNIDTILLFGDKRLIHKVAIEKAHKHNIDIYVFEEGYIRPNWFTLEKDGVNAHSSLGKKPEWYRSVASSISELPTEQEVGPSLRTRALHDMAYHLANFIYAWKFPGYITHRPYKSHIEYFGWAKRFPFLPMRDREAENIILNLLNNHTPYFVFPMQLDADAQIREHSPYSGMVEALDEIITSFAKFADTKQELVIKNHPLDTGLINYRQQIDLLCKSLKIERRVHYIDGGHLPTLLQHTQGTVTINSTVGLSAIFHKSPTITLGNAIYDMPGMTFQGNLNDFWRAPMKPDQELFHDFRRVVVFLTQINGGFYTERGIQLAIPHCIHRLTTNSSYDEIDTD